MTSLFAFVEAKNHTTQRQREAISDDSFAQLARDQKDLIPIVWLSDLSGVYVF